MSHPDSVKVEQVDREAAAALAQWLTDAQKEWDGMAVWFASDAPSAFRRGAFDEHDFVQAFARHRIAALQAAAERERSLVEAVRKAHAVLVELVEPDMSQSAINVYARCRSAELSARQALGESA